MKHRIGFTMLALGMLFSVLLIVPPTAHAQSSTPLLNMPTANYTVRAIVPDGAGGVYIGGNFTLLTPASGPAVTRKRIARINANGSIHAWNPNASDIVFALAVNGSTVYAGGYFTTIGGQTRNCIAALDATTGLAMAWNPIADNSVLALAVSGSTIYAGGDFATIGGAARAQFAAFGPAAEPTPVPTARPSEVPEGNTLLLLGGGMGGLGVWLRYQWSKRKRAVK